MITKFKLFESALPDDILNNLYDKLVFNVYKGKKRITKSLE